MFTEPNLVLHISWKFYDNATTRSLDMRLSSRVGHVFFAYQSNIIYVQVSFLITIKVVSICW